MCSCSFFAEKRKNVVTNGICRKMLKMFIQPLVIVFDFCESSRMGEGQTNVFTATASWDKSRTILEFVENTQKEIY